MSTPVTLTLPDELYEQARQWAVITRRGVPEALTDVLSIALKPVRAVPSIEKPVAKLSDKELLALTQAEMPPHQGQRLSQLLALQQDDALNEQEQAELLSLMQNYQHIWLRQSEALAEAVKRGLRAPLEP
jgi:hypothetical protein